MMPPVPRISPLPYYEGMEVCVYPPSTAINVNYISNFAPDFEKRVTDKKALDFTDRQGVCFGKKLGDADYSLKNFVVTYEIDHALLMQRLSYVAITIACFVGIAWLLRLIL